MVAVGFNPRVLSASNDFVAERRLNRCRGVGPQFDAGCIRFNRRSATNPACIVRIRGLKPTATVGCRSATNTPRQEHHSTTLIPPDVGVTVLCRLLSLNVPFYNWNNRSRRCPLGLR